jgi:hypothetical protein
MGVTGSANALRLARSLAAAAVAAAALLAGALLLAPAGLAAAPAARPRAARVPAARVPAPAVIARSSSALYYETATRTGQLAIDRLSLSGRHASTEVVALGNVTVFGIALSARYIYWSIQAGLSDQGAIMRATLDGRNVRQLVTGLLSPGSVVAVHGFVYWNAENSIGRMTLNGSRVQRRFLVLPQEEGGGVADGLASDGTHLYFTRCSDNAIGRVDLNGQDVEQALISLAPASCPQGIAVGGRNIYWTQLGAGTIGRARLDGGDADGRWFDIHSNEGPFQVAADTAHVYWTWGGVAGSPSYTGRVDTNGSHPDRRFLFDSLFPIALAGPPAKPF